MKERPTNVLHSTPKIQQADTLLKKSIKLLPAVLFLSQVLHATLIGLNELITVIGMHTLRKYYSSTDHYCNR